MLLCVGSYLAAQFVCIVYFWPSKFFHLASADLKVSGASFRSSGSYILALMAAWGQTREHLPHWMQSDGSHAGISIAMLRFSYCVVPLGTVPSWDSMFPPAIFQRRSSN